jgi:hypothetical protein
MKTNLVDLMSEVSRLEERASELYSYLVRNNTNEYTIELDGRKQELKVYEDYEAKYKDYKNTLENINIMKRIISEKNNELRLNNGRTIQSTLIEISNKRKLLGLIQSLLRKNPSKERITEVNNSYFLSKELAFDKNQLQDEERDLIEEIKTLEFEISVLNSQTFEI